MLTALLLPLVMLAAPPAQAVDGVSAADDVFTVSSGEYESVDVGANDTFPTDGSVYFQLVDSYIDGYIAESSEHPGVFELSTPRTFTGPVDLTYGIFDRGAPEAGPLATATLRLSGTPAGSVSAADDSLAAVVGGSTQIDLSANDTGVVGTDQYWIEWDPAPTSLGELWVDSVGTAYFTPTSTGTDSVVYEVRDQYGGTLASALLELTVTQRATTVTDDQATVEAGEWVPIDVVANDGDVLDGDSIDLTSWPGSGDVDYWGTHLSYYAPTWFTGTDTFQYTLYDQDYNELGTATVTVTVTPAPPLKARDDHDEVERDLATPLHVLENDTHDWGDDPPTLEIVTDPAHGAVGVVADDPDSWEPYVVYTPADGFVGSDSFEYRLSDGTGNTDTALVSLDVALLGPRWLDIEPTLTGARLSWTNPRSPALVGIVGRYAVAPAAGEYVEPPASPDEGMPIPGLTGTMDEIVMDGLPTGHGTAVSLWADYGDGELAGPLQEWFTPTVEPVRDLVAEGLDQAVQLTWTNPPGVDRITVSHSPEGSSEEPVVVELTAVEQTTVEGLQNGVGHEFSVVTHHGDLSSTAYAWAVPRGFNTAPEAEDDYVALRGDEPVRISPTANDTDADDDYLQVIDLSEPSVGTVEWVDGELVYDPPSADSPSVDVQYTVSDGHGGRDSATVHLVRRPAFVGQPDAATVPAGESVVIDVLGNDGVGGVAYDALPGDYLDSAHEDLGYAWGTTDGLGRPVLEFGAGESEGTTTVGYTLYDDYGEVIGSSTVEVTVTEPLRLSARDDYTEIPANTTTPIDVLANDTYLTEVSIGVVEQPANGTVVVDDTGDVPTVLVTPDPGFQGSDSFGYRLIDEEGNDDTALVTYDVWRAGVTDLTATGAPDRIELTWVNPDAADLAEIVVRYLPDEEGWIESPEDGLGWPLVGTPETATITGLEPGVGYSVHVFAVFDDGDYVGSAEWVRTSVPPVTGLSAVAGDGTAVLSWDNPVGVDAIVVRYSTEEGSFPWSPDEGTGHPVTGTPETTTLTGLENGTTYYVSVFAQGSGTTSYPETVVVTPKSGANNAPVATDDDVTVAVGGSAWFDPTLNDTDADGDALSLEGWTQPGHGDLTCNVEDPNVCSYVPAPGYVGTDSFTYTVDDGRGAQDTGTVTVDVYQPNRRPVALNDVATTATGQAVQVDVAANDSDPDGDPLSYTLKDPPAHGTATVTPAGLATYTPDDGFVGDDVFGYLADDGQGGTRSATVTVTVEDRTVPLVSITASRTSVSVKGAVVVSGRVTPARVGTPVELQRLDAGTWSTIMTSATKVASDAEDVANGAPYSFTVKQAVSGTYRYRVHLPADGVSTETTSTEVTVKYYAVGFGKLRRTGNEWIAVKNTGKVTVNLKGWAITNRAGKVLGLPSRVLAAGKSVRVHPGRGRTTATDIYLRRGPSFGDRHDTLRLRDVVKVVVAVKTY